MAELLHGGRLREAAARYGLPYERWVDLSTGINPDGWPVPALPVSAWQRLPEEEDGLVAAATGYYGTPHLLACAGSQAAIQWLPRLCAPGRVGVVTPGYAEHAAAWLAAGHEVVHLAPGDVAAHVHQLQVLVVINPNNPTGDSFAPEQLREWHTQLAARGGWLVVDEAFMDVTPAHSLAGHAGVEGLVVLRSLGKFFGLAGARVGFVLAWPQLLARLGDSLGPWTINHPARLVATLALGDTAWQVQQRAQLSQRAARLGSLLRDAGFAPHGGTALFQYVTLADAAVVADALARQAILVRRFAQPSALRFGLPGDEMQWQRLTQALESLR